MPMNDLIAVAMSGGVDSSVVAAMLRSEGRNVVGLTMQLWNQRRLPEVQAEGPTGRCCSLDDVYDARAVATHIGIPHYVLNFERRFESDVVKPFIDDYLAGRTPNPCTLCNNHIKFDQFIETAEGSGAARSRPAITLASISTPRPSATVSAAVSTTPRTKPTFSSGSPSGSSRGRVSAWRYGEARGAFARRPPRRPHGQQGDSQEICFVPNGDYAAFIEAWFREQGIEPQAASGEIVDTSGKPVGAHAGVHHFTVGQRKGLGIAAPEPLYVISTELASRRVIVGSNDELLRDSLTATGVNWVSIPPISAERPAQVKIRYKHTAAPATLIPDAGSNRVQVRFAEPQRAITPGQAAVFYDGDTVLGGGWIE